MINNVMKKVNPKIICSHCSICNNRKNGFVFGIQRYYCKNCKRNFTMKAKRNPLGIKRFAILLYLNNMGIRKIAKMVNVSHPTILRWLKEAHSFLEKQKSALGNKECDIIEFDEIYTFVKKNSTGFPIGLLFLENKAVLLRLK